MPGLDGARLALAELRTISAKANIAMLEVSVYEFSTSGIKHKGRPSQVGSFSY